MNFKITKKTAISLAALAGGAYYCLHDPQILALFPEPWGMIIGKFVTGLAVGGVGYSMQPKQDVPKE